MGKSAPEQPDPRETSAASTATNVGTAIANAYMGNVNQVTPDGTLTYDQSGEYQWRDPYTGQTYRIPTFTATQELSPQQQAIYDQNKGAQLNLATLANNQSSFLNDYMAEPFRYDTNDHEKWALDLYEKLNSESQNTQQEQLMARLANQGIQVGTQAYDDSMQNLLKSQGDSRNQFLLDSYKTGFGSAQATRNQPINEITALLSGSQVSQPSFVNSQQPTIPTTDVAGIIQQNYQNELAAWQQQNSLTGNILGGLFGLGANIIASDERLKTDIKKVGKTDDGLNVYSYRYKAGGPTQIGLMAQEVREKKPEAVANIGGGYLGVDYGKATT